MKEIKWKKYDKEEHKAVMGSMRIYCRRYRMPSGVFRWQTSVSMDGLHDHWRDGPDRCLLSTAKIDAVRLVGELLVDCYAGIIREMKCCGVEL